MKDNIKALVAKDEKISELQSQTDELAHDLNAKEYECRAYSEKIAELEKENLKAHGWIAKAMMQGLSKVDCSDELLKIIAKRDLEQQAKCADDVIESVLGDALSIRNEFLDREKQLPPKAVIYE